MRVTRDVLLNIAKEAVSRKLKQETSLSIIAAYLHGSVLGNAPLLGDTTDVDLVFIFPGRERRREIMRVTDDLTVDIEYHPQELYRPPRKLRINPWLGYTIYYCEALHDPSHFIDFVQASVRGLFNTSENIMGRAEPLLREARQIWMRYHTQIPESGPKLIAEYLSTLERIVNAIALLNGGPLTERRFLLQFPERAQAIGIPGLYADLLNLLGVAGMDSAELSAWLPDWEKAYRTLGGMPIVPPHLHPSRRIYHLHAYRAILAGIQPLAVTWPLLRTWTHIVRFLPTEGQLFQKWVDVCDQLNLLNDHFVQKVDALDAFLDTVEELFEDWKREHGLL
jgi:hypothetical protein